MFCGRIITASAEDGPGTANHWEKAQLSGGEGYFLRSSVLDGFCITADTVERTNKTVQYQVCIDQDILWFRSQSDHIQGFTNTAWEGTLFSNALFRTESGVFGMGKVMLGYGFGEYVFAPDSTIFGMPVNDYLLETMKNGESFDIWLSLGEWTNYRVLTYEDQAADEKTYRYAVVHFTVTMDDPDFAVLLENAREDNWGYREDTSVPKLNTGYESMKEIWTALHFLDSAGEYQAGYYLKTETEGIMVSDDLSGRKILVTAYADVNGLSFSLQILQDGVWVPVTNYGEPFDSDIRMNTSEKGILHLRSRMNSGSSELLILDSENESLSGGSAILEEMTGAGFVNVEISLSLMDNNGAASDAFGTKSR